MISSNHGINLDFFWLQCCQKYLRCIEQANHVDGKWRFQDEDSYFRGTGMFCLLTATSSPKLCLCAGYWANDHDHDHDSYSNVVKGYGPNLYYFQENLQVSAFLLKGLARVKQLLQPHEPCTNTKDDQSISILILQNHCIIIV